MVFCLAGGAEDSDPSRIGRRQQVRADGAGRRRTQAGDRDVVRQLGAGDLADDDALQLALGRVIKNDHRMIKTRVDLFFGHRFDPLAMSH